jgi:hypothetical protein
MDGEVAGIGRPTNGIDGRPHIIVDATVRGTADEGAPRDEELDSQ